jgi:hypothetical protein
MVRAGVAVLVCVAFLSTGCLQQTHKIPRGELMRLSMTPPEQRGQSVRVIQDLAGEQPPAATRVESGAHVDVIIIPDIHVGGGRRPPPRPPNGVRPGGGGGHSSGGGSGLAGMKGDEAWVLVLIAASFAIVLAATEGSRYDGWVNLHPMHPVHMWGPGGYAVLPLAHIDPSTAAWAERAVVRPSEGPWRRLGRAPLDRAGFTYSVLVGAGTSISGDSTEAAGAAARVQFGYFPMHQLGVQLDWGFTTRRNAVDEALYDSRLGVEATFAPLDVGRFHAGVFGGIAVASRFEDGVPDGRDDDTALSGGALLQLEITTRLAISGRFGMSRAFDDVTQDALVGLAIY